MSDPVIFLYVVERGGPDRDTEATAPMPLRGARRAALRRMNGHEWPKAKVRPGLGEVDAWEAESGDWVTIRTAYGSEREA